MSGMLPDFVISILTIVTTLFVLVVGVAVLGVAVLYILDVSHQSFCLPSRCGSSATA